MNLSKTDKRIHLLAAIAAAVVLLAACGGGGDAYATVEGDTQDTQDAQDDGAPATVTIAPVRGPMLQQPEVTPLPPAAECAKPDPQPTHGRDPACHGS